MKLFVGQVSFEVLDNDQRDDLNEIPTRLRLETPQVDAVIAAGEQATRLTPEFNGFLRAIDAVPAPADARRIGARRITRGTDGSLVPMHHKLAHCTHKYAQTGCFGTLIVVVVNGGSADKV